MIFKFRFKNGFNGLHPVNTLERCERNLYFLWDCLKHIGGSLFLEIVTTPKETAICHMPFHDYGVVVFRFGLSHS